METPDENPRTVIPFTATGWGATARAGRDLVVEWMRELAVATGTTLATIGMLRIEPNVINVIARIAPAAMIFVPSRGGISHNPREHTDDEQLVDGANVLLDVVLARLAAC